MTIELANGDHAQASYRGHLRTLTGSYNEDLELYRLDDGREVVCTSPSNDCRATPVEIEGLTAAAAMFRH